MTQTVPAPPSAPASKGLVSRVVGVLTAPRATYADVAARPRVLGMLVLLIVISAAGTFTFLSTEVGRQAMLDNQVRQMESFGRTVSDAQYQRMEQMAPYGRYFAVASQVIVLPIVAAIIAGLAFGIFNGVMGGDASFKQVYAVVVHSGVVPVVLQTALLPLAYARETLSSATNLAVFFPFLEDNSFPARLLGSIDLILIWWIVSVAIGLGVLYKRRTAPIATTLFVIYGVIGVVIAAVKTALQ